MRLIDLFLTMPYIAVAATLAYRYAGRANGWVYLAVILAALAWMPIARVMRGVFLSLREKEYVEAAQGPRCDRPAHHLPASPPQRRGPDHRQRHPYRRHRHPRRDRAVLPRSRHSTAGHVARPARQLRRQQAATDRPWLFYFPGLFIIIIVLTVNFVGDGLRDAFDPDPDQGAGLWRRTRGRHRPTRAMSSTPWRPRATTSKATADRPSRVGGGCWIRLPGTHHCWS